MKPQLLRLSWWHEMMIDTKLCCQSSLLLLPVLLLSWSGTMSAKTFMLFKLLWNFLWKLLRPPFFFLNWPYRKTAFRATSALSNCNQKEPLCITTTFATIITYTSQVYSRENYSKPQSNNSPISMKILDLTIMGNLKTFTNLLLLSQRLRPSLQTKTLTSAYRFLQEFLF